MDTHTSRLFAVVLLSVIGCSTDQVLPPGPLTGEVGGNITFKPTISPTSPELLTIAWNFKPVNGSGPVSVIGSGPGGSTPGLGYEDRVSVNRVTGSLELRQLTLRDPGVYTVTLTLNTGATQTAETTLKVYEPASSVTVRANATDLVEFNDTVELTCSALGSSLFYQWHNGSSDITTSEGVHLSDGNRILTISGVLRSDRGPLSCTVFNVISNGTSPPVFLNISFGPDNIEVAVDPLKEFYTQGSNVTLSCSAQSSPPAEFKWAFNGTMLNTDGQELKLENIQEDQSGSYTCWAHNIKTLRFTPSDRLLISVIEPVSIVTVRSNATDLVEFNDTVELTCSALGSSLFYRWHNGSSDITTSERVHLSDDNRILTISGVLRSDRGRLSCTVYNVISNGTSPPVFLNISFGPDNVEVAVDPLKEFHIQGSNVTLSCSAQSSPPAEFKWAFNGTMLTTEGQELKLENIQEDQSGSYSCWAHNIKTLRFTPSDPLLISLIEKISGASITGPTEVLIAGNRSANLSCQTTAGTIISRKWLKDGRPLSPSIRIAFSGENSSVSIDPLQGTDNGQYQCILTNPVSTDSASYNLTVNYGPENVVIQGHSEIEVGHTVVLTCSASSVPRATFTWAFNGKETAVITEEYTVENAASSDSGTYTCVAKNSVTGSDISSTPHVLTVKESNSGSQLGAILGGIFGAVACVTVAGAAFVYMKKKKRSSSTTTHRGGGNTSNQQSNGGDVTYAEVTHFRKADGSNIQLGSVKAQATPETGPVDVGMQESPYAEVKKN